MQCSTPVWRRAASGGLGPSAPSAATPPPDGRGSPTISPHAAPASRMLYCVCLLHIVVCCTAHAASVGHVTPCCTCRTRPTCMRCDLRACVRACACVCVRESACAATEGCLLHLAHVAHLLVELWEYLNTQSTIRLVRFPHPPHTPVLHSSFTR